MGRKINPIVHRLGYTRNWKIESYLGHGDDYSQKLKSIYRLMAYIKNYLLLNNIKSEIVRIRLTPLKLIIITRLVQTPSVSALRKLVKKKNINYILNDLIKNIKKLLPYSFQNIQFIIKRLKSDINSTELFTDNLSDIIKKKLIIPPLKNISNIKGLKILLSGRIRNPRAISKKYLKGSVPLQKLSDNISYHHKPILTKTGILGLKVWLNYPYHRQKLFKVYNNPSLKFSNTSLSPFSSSAKLKFKN